MYEVKPLSGLINLLNTTVPLVGAILGIILLVVGIILLSTGRRQRGTHSSGYQTTSA